MMSNEGATQGPSVTSKMKRLGAGNDVITGGEFSMVIASLLELIVTPMKGLLGCRFQSAKRNGILNCYDPSQEMICRQLVGCNVGN